jgi:hypothetical protein
MVTFANLPVYFNCLLLRNRNARHASMYKIQFSQNQQYPFQLLKQRNGEPGRWENLSVYATIDDAVIVLLKELCSADLTDEVYHGQASLNPGPILQKIVSGESGVSIYDSKDQDAFDPDRDIAFEDLIDRNAQTQQLRTDDESIK